MRRVGLVDAGSESPLAGLRRRSLGPVEVTGQSVAVTAPSAAMASTPALVAAQAGNGTLYAYVAAAVVVILTGYCISQFARRMASSGSLYSFTARGLGPLPAAASAVGLLLGYALLAMSTLLLTASSLSDASVRVGLPGARHPAVDAAVVGVAGLAVCVCLVRGVRLSSRVALSVEGCSVLAIVVVLSILTVRKPAVDVSLLTASGADLHGIGLGVALAITSFVGFESAAALGVEARRPHQSIPRAIIRTSLVAAVLYLASTYVQLVGFRGVPGGLAGSPAPLADLARRTGPWLPALLDLGVAASGFACAMGAATALSRLLFTMAREGLLPPAVGRTSPCFGTPYVACLAAMLPVLPVPVALAAAGVSPAAGFRVLVTLSTFGYMLAYVLVCIALPRFLQTIGELTWSPRLAGPMSGVLLLGVFATYAVPTSGEGNATLLAAFLLLEGMVLAAVQRALRARPARFAALGAHDEPTVADFYDLPPVAAS